MKLTIVCSVIWTVVLMLLWFTDVGAETWVERCNICEGDREGHYVCTAMYCGTHKNNEVWDKYKIPLLEKTNKEGLTTEWGNMLYGTSSKIIKFGIRSDGVVVWRKE